MYLSKSNIRENSEYLHGGLGGREHYSWVWLGLLGGEGGDDEDDNEECRQEAGGCEQGVGSDFHGLHSIHKK